MESSPVSGYFHSPSGEERDRSGDEQAHGVISAVDKRATAHFGQRAMVSEEEPTALGLPIERIATEDHRGDEERNEISETENADDSPSSGAHLLSYRR